MVAKAEITGGVGIEPPAHAPREVSQPLSEAAIVEAYAKAQQNERELQPLVFNTQRPHASAARPPITQPAVSAVDAVSSGGRRIRQVHRSSRPEPEGGPAASGTTQQIVLTDADAHVPAEPERILTTADLSAGAIDEPQSHQRAGSNTDSPSRGVPRAIDDPGKKITGGFGAANAAQYYPLDGTELRELVYSLLDQIHARLQDDLRFSMAICYPRVSARVDVIIDGYPEDTGFVIPVVAKPHDKTPIEIAQQHADDVVFVVKAERVEMTTDGQSVSPPNLIRQELGMRVPRKQAVETPTGRMMVDVTQ